MRLGHPARVVESVQRFSLDALLTRSDSAAIISDVRRDLEKAMVSTYCGLYSLGGRLRLRRGEGGRKESLKGGRERGRGEGGGKEGPSIEGME